MAVPSLSLCDRVLEVVVVDILAEAPADEDTRGIVSVLHDTEEPSRQNIHINCSSHGPVSMIVLWRPNGKVHEPAEVLPPLNVEAPSIRRSMCIWDPCVLCIVDRTHGLIV